MMRTGVELGAAPHPGPLPSLRGEGILLVFWLLAGCVGPLGSLRVEKPLTVDSARFSIRSDGRTDVTPIEHALAEAPAGLAKWGGLEAPVTVYVVGTHDDLEAAVHRRGFGWLRAWARYDDVVFQAPSTWTTNAEVVDELVLHELTHCLLFQRTGTADTWKEKKIPLWFREGMAVVTARQQRLYPSLEDAAHWVETHPESDVFLDGDALSADHYLEVYGFSLHAFTFLERRYGSAKLMKLFSLMREGADFTTGFAAAMGTPLENFQRDFSSYLRLRAFRGTGRTIPANRLDLRRLIESRERPGS